MLVYSRKMAGCVFVLPLALPVGSGSVILGNSLLPSLILILHRYGIRLGMKLRVMPMRLVMLGKIDLRFKPVKREGYRSLRQFYRMLRRENKVCKKHGIRVRFDIELPV